MPRKAKKQQQEQSPEIELAPAPLTEAEQQQCLDRIEAHCARVEEIGRESRWLQAMGKPEGKLRDEALSLLLDDYLGCWDKSPAAEAVAMDRLALAYNARLRLEESRMTPDQRKKVRQGRAVEQHGHLYEAIRDSILAAGLEDEAVMGRYRLFSETWRRLLEDPSSANVKALEALLS